MKRARKKKHETAEALVLEHIRKLNADRQARYRAKKRAAKKVEML